MSSMEGKRSAILGHGEEVDRQGGDSGNVEVETRNEQVNVLVLGRIPGVEDNWKGRLANSGIVDNCQVESGTCFEIHQLSTGEDAGLGKQG